MKIWMWRTMFFLIGNKNDYTTTEIMKKAMFTLFLILFCLACTDSKKLPKTGQFYDKQEKETGWVYICIGRSSHAYHSNRECFGLSSCSREILKVTLEDAQEDGRTPCHFCHEKE